MDAVDRIALFGRANLQSAERPSRSVVSLAATGATAVTKPGAKAARPAATNPAVIECYKRSGGSYNPVTKRWAIHMNEFDMTVRSDTLRQCIARATGASPG
jgi:hypothetical protein